MFNKIAEDLILPLLGYNGDEEEDDKTDSDEGIDNKSEDNNFEDNSNNRPQRIEYDTT